MESKNTLIGLGLMLLVILGFSYFSPKNESQTTDTENASTTDTHNTDEEVIIRPFTPEEASAIPAAVMAANNVVNDSLYTLTSGGVSLTYDKTNGLAGTVAVGKDRLDVNDLVQNQFPEEMTADRRSEALSTLRRALDNASAYQGFTAHFEGEEKTLELANDVIDLTINTHGGRISRAVLKKYYTYFPDADDKHLTDTADVVLFENKTNTYGFKFTLANRQLDTRDLYFTLDEATSNDTTKLMKVDLGNGAWWGIRYTLAPGSYVVGMTVEQNGMDRVLPANTSTVSFDWWQKMKRQELGRTFEEQKSGIYYKLNSDSPDDLGDREKSEEINQSLRWVAYKNQFFSSVFIADKPMTSAHLAQKPSNEVDYVKEMDMTATLDYNINDATPASFHLYLGPNLYPLLNDIEDEIVADTDLDLTRLVPLGWSWLRWINTLIIIPVFTFLGKFISSYGLIIFLLTIFIKILIFPFTYKSYMSQAKMRVLAPEIKEINEKYPGNENAMTRQTKTMALYSSAGASPMSGCLPMLLQMPILIAMFWFFPSCIELRGQSFLWAHNLAAPDVIFTLPFYIPGYGSHVSLFCLLMTVTNIVYTRINMQNQPSNSSMPMMKWMMYLMPVMFLVFFNQYAAALSYYYFLSLLITIVQTYIFRRCINEEKVRQHMLENAKKPRKKSGFAARLEEAQRRQQAMLREQQKRNGKR